jgi:hypothetical protein
MIGAGRNAQSPSRIETPIERIQADENSPQRPERPKFACSLSEFYDYLEANRDLIPYCGDRRRHEEAISSPIADDATAPVQCMVARAKLSGGHARAITAEIS